MNICKCVSTRKKVIVVGKQQFHRYNRNKSWEKSSQNICKTKINSHEKPSNQWVVGAKCGGARRRNLWLSSSSFVLLKILKHKYSKIPSPPPSLNNWHSIQTKQINKSIMMTTIQSNIIISIFYHIQAQKYCKNRK